MIVSCDAKVAREADALVVPGVGAFAACMQQLRAIDGDQAIIDRVGAGRPTLGICVGMQILFEIGVEHGRQTAGLSLWPGRVEALDAEVLPHMGWNTVRPEVGSQLFEGISDQRFYFVHSYAAKAAPRNGIAAWSEYGGEFLAACEVGHLAATQFHPEKSGEAGLALLSNWVRGL